MTWEIRRTTYIPTWYSLRSAPTWTFHSKGFLVELRCPALLVSPYWRIQRFNSQSDLKSAR